MREKGGENSPMDESVPVSKAVGEKGAVSSQMSPGEEEEVFTCDWGLQA